MQGERGVLRHSLRRRTQRLVAGIMIGLVVVVLLIPLPAHWHGTWQSKFFDLGHVPLFTGLTLILWWCLGVSWVWPALIGVLLAAATEIAQLHTGRSGNVPDFVRGALGVLVAVALIRAWQRPRTWRGLCCHALIVLALIAWPLLDSGPYLLDAYEGWRSFPVLADFRTPGEMLRWHTQQSILSRTRGHDGGWRGHLELLPGPAEYPGAVLEPIMHDFSRFRRICWSIATEGEPPSLVFSIRSGRDGANPSNHYQFPRTFQPGEHRVEADLKAIVPQAVPARLDLTNIIALQIFMVRPERATTVYIRRVWLE
jgi:hypothetical protein